MNFRAPDHTLNKFLLLLVISITVLCGIGIGLQQANASNPGTSNSAPLGQDLGKYIQFYEDTQGQLDIHRITKTNIRWQQSEKDNLHLGFSDSTFWLKLALPEYQQQELILQFTNNKLDLIEVYLSDQRAPNGFRKLKSGYHQSITERAHPHRNFIFPLALQDSGSTIYIRVKSNYPLIMNAFLWEPAQFSLADHSDTIWQGIYLGWIFGLALYNLFLYLSVRDRSYLVYFLFMVSLATFQTIEKGLAYQYLWPSSPEWDGQAFMLFICLGAGSSVWFTDEFLQLRQNHALLHKCLVVIMGIWVVLGLATLIAPSPLVLIAQMTVVIPGGCLLFFSGMYMWHKGFVPAKYYIIAWAAIIYGCTLHAFYLVGLAPDFLYHKNIFQITNLIEATLLSLGLARRIKTLDEEKQNAQAETRAKSMFLAQMSHEIRTPMNGVLGMSELLNNTQLDDKQRHYLDVVRSSGESLLSIINDILDFSKIEAGKLEIEDIGFNLEKLMDESLAVFGLPASKKGLTLINWIKPGTPLGLQGDPLRIRQVILNLLSNAFKFTADGNIILRAELLNPDEPHLNQQDRFKIKFSIEDSGIGISKANQAKLFSQYTQAESSTSRKFGGTGLGLTICKQLSQLMGGEIGLDSVEGEGTTFWFTIETQVNDEYEPQTEILSCFQDLHVLVVDDNPIFVDFIKEHALNWGMQVSMAFNVEAAKSLLNKQRFDLITLDQSLPDGQGLDLAHFINQQVTSQPPLIMITGHRSELNSGEIKQAGIILSQNKPISGQELKRCFASALGQQLPALQQQQEKQIEALNLHALVAEDNQVNQLVIKGVLNRLGVTLELANDGEEALKLITGKKHQFDCILMDCEMPNMDGYEATRKIRAWEQEKSLAPMKIYALSAHAMAEEVRKSKEAGMDHHIPKPIKIEELYTVLKQGLSFSSERRH